MIMKKFIRPTNKEERLSMRCRCGNAFSAMMQHYDLVTCKCSRIFWALQPHRDGPLKLFPWPGDYRTGAIAQ